MYYYSSVRISLRRLRSQKIYEHPRLNSCIIVYIVNKGKMKHELIQQGFGFFYDNIKTYKPRDPKFIFYLTDARPGSMKKVLSSGSCGPRRYRFLVIHTHYTQYIRVY